MTKQPRQCGCYVSFGEWDEGNERIRHVKDLLPTENEFCEWCLNGGCQAVKRRFEAKQRTLAKKGA